MITRSSGILMPISSLPSPYGIGTFGKAAYEYADFLAACGLTYWQVLPLGQTSYGDSPYQSFSSFAGNPYFIDFDMLIEEGLLKKSDLEGINWGTNPRYVDYGKIWESRYKILAIAKERGWDANLEDINRFRDENHRWIEEYALYMACKKHFGMKSWIEWEDDEIRLHHWDAVNRYREELREDVELFVFIQYLFFKQWTKLKKYINDLGLKIIGDIPIYVAFDSADTWANPELFQLDKKNTPIDVAGCPPDAFSATGQLWGNPLYKWDYHEKTGYKWWMKRIAHCYKLYDVVRIDHFRGFDEYYAIPYGDPTAEFGEWRKGPGYKLFETMKKELGEKKVIAEDLGFLTPSVIKLVKKTGYPGMKILQFAFDSREESDYLPHNYTNNCIVYTGTHDNDTTRSWFDKLPRDDKKFAKEYLGIKTGKDAVWATIRASFASVSDTVIIPMQDYLELPGYARINTPSTLGGNWVWRMKKDALSPELCAKMHDFARIYRRLSK